MNQLAENSQVIWLAGMFPGYLQLARNKTAYHDIGSTKGRYSRGGYSMCQYFDHKSHYDCYLGHKRTIIKYIL